MLGIIQNKNIIHVKQTAAEDLWKFCNIFS